MEIDLKRLREDSERLSESIKQLEAQDFDGPQVIHTASDSWFFGSQGLALGFALLFVLGMLLWRMAVARKHMRPQDFVNSEMYRSPEPVSAPSGKKAEKPVEFRSSVWFEDSEQASVALIDEEGPPPSTDGFDFEAAASEVERVRKSLAQKRAQREQLRNAPPTSASPFALSSASVVPIPELALQQPEPVELDAELEFELDFAPNPAMSPPPGSPPPTPTAEPTNTEPMNDGTADAQSESVVLAAPKLEPELVPEPDPEPETVAHVPTHQLVVDVQHNDSAIEDEVIDGLAVKLELAKELYALGLSVQAQELAREVLDSDRSEITQAAHELISRCDALALELERQQQEYAGLLDSLREVGAGRGAA
jgi:hypothetical protein